MKGAPEAILDMCSSARGADGNETELDRDALLEANDALAESGLRVLAMAIGDSEEAARAVREEPPHAAAIAQQVHIDRPAQARQAPEQHREELGRDKLPEVHTGRELSQLADDELDEVLERTNVFARVEPTQKTRLVERLKAQNHIVAVTGDGVNDAPALKTAHLGAAMGSGTDVAKEASDRVITDDNFASVYRAVEQGRTAFRNIRMATFFLLSTGAAFVLVILFALGMRWPLVFLPAQIIWANVVTNGIADVALAFEPGEEALYRRPPRAPSEGVLDRLLLERLVLVGIWLAVGTLDFVTI